MQTSKKSFSDGTVWRVFTNLLPNFILDPYTVGVAHTVLTKPRERTDIVFKAKRKSIVRGLAAAAAAGALSLGVAAPASAIEYVDPFSCSTELYEAIANSNEYADFIFFNANTGKSYPICFSDAGNIQFKPAYRPYTFASGNNAGRLLVSAVPDPTPFVDHWLIPFNKHTLTDLSGLYVHALVIH